MDKSNVSDVFLAQDSKNSRLLFAIKQLSTHTPPRNKYSKVKYLTVLFIFFSFKSKFENIFFIFEQSTVSSTLFLDSGKYKVDYPIKMFLDKKR